MSLRVGCAHALAEARIGVALSSIQRGDLKELYRESLFTILRDFIEKPLGLHRESICSSIRILLHRKESILVICPVLYYIEGTLSEGFGIDR